MSDQISYIQRLSRYLLASCTLNLLLITLLTYVTFGESPPTPYFENKPAFKTEESLSLAQNLTNAKTIRKFRTATLKELILKLNDKHVVENGYTQRDLAISCLVFFHGFDLDRALEGISLPSEKRSIVYGKWKNGSPATVTLYPGLNDSQYQAISQFAKREKWPLKSHGLYRRIQQAYLRHQPIDAELLDAFYLTYEFTSIERLFNRSSVRLNKQVILKMVCEGNWSLLSTFTQQQKSLQDMSPGRRQEFLLSLIDKGSRTAAYVLLLTDFSFAASKLDDKQTIVLLRRLSKKTPQSERFAQSLLRTPRSSTVWRLAKSRLQTYGIEVSISK